MSESVTKKQKGEVKFSECVFSNLWDYVKNGNIKPTDIARRCGKPFWFFHVECGHSFQKVPDKVKETTKCPFCIPGGRLCGIMECKMCFDRSFASIELKFIIWHPTMNGNVRPIDIARRSSTKKIWFYHEECNHSFQKVTDHVTVETLCPYCVTPSRLLCGSKTCLSCFDRSLASFDFSEKNLKWHPTKNVDVDLITVAKFTLKKFWFVCSSCEHEREIIPQCAFKSEDTCRHCTTRNWQHCGEISCDKCAKRSIMSQDKYKYLSNENDHDVWKLGLGSGEYVLYDCPFCLQIYRSIVGEVTKGRWCTCTKNKTETKLLEFLKSTFPTRKMETQVSFEWCRGNSGKLLRFDFCIDDYIIIELDGMQHFRDKIEWNSTASKQQTRDVFKFLTVLEREYRTIRVFQEDVWDDVNDWQNQLINLIEDDSLQSSFVSTTREVVTNAYQIQAQKYIEFQ